MLKLDEVEEGINGIRGVNYVRYITVERKEVERERTRRKRQSEGPPPHKYSHRKKRAGLGRLQRCTGLESRPRAGTSNVMT